MGGLSTSLMKYTGCWTLWTCASIDLWATSVVLTTWVVHERYRYNSSPFCPSCPLIGAVSTGGVERKAFSSSSALCASSVHLNVSSFLRSLKNGRPRSPSHEMNLPSAAMQPVSFCTCFWEVSGCMLVMAVIFSGLASMPRLLTMKPSSLPDGTLNMHFSWLSFHL